MPDIKDVIDKINSTDQVVFEPEFGEDLEIEFFLDIGLEISEEDD